MNQKALLAAAGVFLVLLVAFFATRESKVKVGVKELKIQKIDGANVSKIEFTPPNKAKKGDEAEPAPAPAERRTVVVEKDGANWRVFDAAQADKKFMVDETQSKSLVEALGEIGQGDLIASKKEKHAELEVDDDSGARVKIVGEGGGVLADLVFGRAAKGGGTAMRSAGSDDVFVSKGRLSTFTRRDVAAWRKKAMVEAKADDLTSVSVALAGGEKYVLRAESPPADPAADAPDAGAPEAKKPEWKLVDPATLPPGFRLDAAALSRPASSLATLRAQDFADGASDDAAGFGAAHTIIEATKKDGGKIVLHLGKEDDKKRVHARIDGDPQVYLLPSYTAKQLSKKLDEFRDLALFSGSIDDVEKVVFTAKSAKVVVAKEKGEWKLVEPKSPPPDFDPSQIKTQVGAVMRMKASRLAEGLSANAAGLSQGGQSIELVLAGGKKQVVRFGAAVPPTEEADKKKDDKKKDDKAKGEDKPKEFYASSGIDDLVYVLSAYQKTRYEKPAEIFKKPPAPPPGMGGAGGPSGMENLPPEVRKKLEQSLRTGNIPG